MEILAGNFRMPMKYKICTFTLLFNLVALKVWGLPEGTTPVVGGGTTSLNGKEMVITAPDGSIFEHQSFSVAGDETVRFVQPSEQSRVLNRVTGASLSNINGNILANGQVYLVNPSGIIFGTGAVVEAARLHAISGVLSNDDFIQAVDNFSHLSGSVDNEGVLSADQVIMAGSSVSNQGSINAVQGEVVMGAGGSMIASSADGFLSVSVSQHSTAPIGVATDLVGQTLLNTGIIKAKETQLLGSQITHSGNIESENVVLGDFSVVNAQQGSITADKVSLLGGVDEVTTLGTEKNAGSVYLDSPNNAISQLNLTGNLYEVSMRSNVPTVLAAEGENRSRGSPFLQQGDFRVTGGDLFAQVSFSPVFSGSGSLVLATDQNLYHSTSLADFASTYQVLLMGNNLESSEISNLNNQLNNLRYEYNLYINNYNNDPYYYEFGSIPYSSYDSTYASDLYSQITKLESALDNLHGLEARSLELEELSIPLGASAIQKLVLENPQSSAFSLSGKQAFTLAQAAQVSAEVGESSGLITPTAEIPSAIPDGGSSSGLTSPVSQTPNALPYTQAMEGTDRLTAEQISLAVENGLFSGHSYYLSQAPLSESELVMEAISEAGGANALFGGSYAVVESAAPSSSSTATETDSSGASSDSDSGGDTADDSSGSGDDSSESDSSSSAPGASPGNVPASVLALRALGAVPFAPISAPILSPAASLLLDEALSPQVEAKLQNYIDR
jgi:filamentous hemagglutinin family protein